MNYSGSIEWYHNKGWAYVGTGPFCEAYSRGQDVKSFINRVVARMRAEIWAHRAESFTLSIYNGSGALVEQRQISRSRGWQR